LPAIEPNDHPKKTVWNGLHDVIEQHSKVQQFLTASARGMCSNSNQCATHHEFHRKDATCKSSYKETKLAKVAIAGPQVGGDINKRLAAGEAALVQALHNGTGRASAMVQGHGAHELQHSDPGTAPILPMGSVVALPRGWAALGRVARLIDSR
jgi:hypothetical protein